MNCKTCKWWHRRTDLKKPFGYCERLETTAARTPQTYFAIEVTVADDHDLEVNLCTGPEFGCVLHELAVPSVT